MKKIFTLIVLAALVSAKASAQNSNDGINDLFKGGPGDVNKLLNAYTNPLFKGFGNSLNGGWTNTAKTLKTLRFNLRISASASIVPNSDKTYDVAKLGLSSNITSSSPSIAPTFGGDKDAATPSITYTDQTTGGKYTTALPKGVVQYIPAPQVQLTVGLIKNTDVSLRFIPTTKLSDDIGSLGLFGIGLKHNFSEDFGAAGHVMPFDLALAIGYSRLDYEKPMDVRKDDNVVIPGQSLQGHFSGWSAQAILSKKLLFFTPFVSVGYLASSTDVGLKGNFPFVTGVNFATNKPTYTNYADPISISGSAASTSSMRADVGFQVSLFFLKLYGSYSFAEYQSGNVGIGLGF
ncbi:hypothetical protein KXQ82_05235 [Mucilaginibacter sp. HMF5004]|uniref:DUF6588 family protein n=1 Tax=Mucilaginibacter rivuli TaxID=2857527 RepID=UPI001C5EB12E|nr:DUF6588 family protein [Mucilaginibacter rivuli]MBW4889105.1 hypothetical protein [Mucilaginibacter rivuli]